MAETLPSPPPSPALDSPHSEQILSEKLDALLESYLELLDTYTTLRETLSKSFGAGFLSLAQAQRHANSTIGAGRRFGQESYDERMKALRRIHIEGDEEQKAKIAVQKYEACQEHNSREQENASEKADSTKSDPARRDPLRWFGILVPTALRQTQAHFTAAVQETVPELLRIESRMSQVEEEIWDVRKQMGILDEYKT